MTGHEKNIEEVRGWRRKVEAALENLTPAKQQEKIRSDVAPIIKRLGLEYTNSAAHGQKIA